MNPELDCQQATLQITGDVMEMIAQRDKVAPKTEFVLNEWIPFLNDWCDPDDAAALVVQQRLS